MNRKVKGSVYKEIPRAFHHVPLDNPEATTRRRSSNSSRSYKSAAIMQAATASITPVAAHPIAVCKAGSRTAPVIFLLAVISIITIMIGGAATPLITALQNNRLNRIYCDEKFIATPSRVAPHRIP